MNATGSTVHGIDLGTTNSCISRFDNGSFEIIPIDGKATVPSAVAWANDRWIFGLEANNHLQIAPQQGARSFKRHMGENHVTYTIAGKSYTPLELSEKLLAYIKDRAEQVTEETVCDVVITVPAWFHDLQRRETIEAGRRAGLNVIRIINEPTAAALAYELADPETNTHQEQTWLVYDLGGGTFDVSVIQVKDEYKEVLASTGNTYLGGDDFDHKITEWLVDGLKDRHNVDVKDDVLAMARLKFLAEDTKIRLSTEADVTLTDFIPFADRTLELDVTMDREKFESLIDEYIKSTIDKTEQALAQANLQADAIDRLLLVGGSTRIPLVRERLFAAFGLEPDAKVDPDISVALGAGVQAAITKGLSFSHAVVDVAPHSLGVAAVGDEDEWSDLGEKMAKSPRELAGDHQMAQIRDRHPLTFVPMVRCNSRLPARFVKTFFTGAPYQKQVEVAVYQGESRLTRENTFIGSFIVDIAPQPDIVPIQIGFEYDLNGIIKVSVKDQSDHSNIKRYTMDLNRPSDANLDHRLLAESQEDTYDIEYETDDESATQEIQQAEATNFLIEKIEGRLSLLSATEGDSVRMLLSEYKHHLQLGDDDKLDDLEEKLYDWLEQSDQDSIQPSL
jgi:molecular chaperone DnaK